MSRQELAAGGFPITAVHVLFSSHSLSLAVSSYPSFSPRLFFCGFLTSFTLAPSPTEYPRLVHHYERSHSSAVIVPHHIALCDDYFSSALKNFPLPLLHLTLDELCPPSSKVREINIMLCLKHENIVEVQEMVPPLLVFLPLAFSPLFHLFFVTFPLPSPPLILLLYTFVLFDLFFLLPPLSKTR